MFQLLITTNSQLFETVFFFFFFFLPASEKEVVCLCFFIYCQHVNKTILALRTARQRPKTISWTTKCDASYRPKFGGVKVMENGESQKDESWDFGVSLELRIWTGFGVSFFFFVLACCNRKYGVKSEHRSSLKFVKLPGAHSLYGATGRAGCRGSRRKRHVPFFFFFDSFFLLYFILIYFLLFFDIFFDIFWYCGFMKMYYYFSFKQSLGKITASEPPFSDWGSSPENLLSVLWTNL